MATVATPAGQATELLKNLTLDSQTKNVEAAPEATKKGSVDTGDANGQVQSQEKAAPPHLQDFVDSSTCYVPNAYPSTAYYYGYENGMTGEWGDEYSRYMSQDGVDMTHGVYGDNGSLLYHPGYGYASYDAYSPASSPVPTMGHDGLYGPQHYQYPPTPYYQPPTPPPSGPYSSNQTSAAPTDVPTSVAADQAPASVEAASGNANGVSKGSVGGNNNNGTVPVKSANANSNLNTNTNDSYGRGVFPGGIPTYQGPRFYDGMRPWLDGPFSPDGQARPATSSSLSSTVPPNNSFQSGRNQDLRSLPHNLMGMHSQRPATITSSTFMNKYYPPSNRLYGQCGNTFRTGFASNGYDSRTSGRLYYPVDNTYKPRGRGNGYYSYGNENMDGLNELNRGPRARGFKNQKGFTPVTLAVKGQTLPGSVVNEEKEAATVAPNKEEYNKADFPEKYSEAKFFIIKSYSEDDVHKSIKYSVWASTSNGNKKLDAGYREAQEKPGGCPVFLLFSVNTSGQFVGLAEMTGPVDFNKSVEYWQQDKWNGCFPVKWHIVKDVPNSLLKHITLENNDNKPVTNSRDTQEVKLEHGLQLIKIFKDHSSKTCILDDFGFYEGRQKTIQEKRAKQQIYKQVWDSKPTADAVVVDTTEKHKEVANGKVSLPKLEASTVLVESSVMDGKLPKPLLEENGSVKVSADAPKAAKPVVATTEKRVLSNGNANVAKGC